MSDADAFAGHRARRRFSQNFLVDPGVVERIVAALAPRVGDRIVEIGPGRGALTAQLLAAPGELVVLEIDRDLARGLAERFPELRIVEGDALRVDYETLFPDTAPFRVLGNLPYHITSPLLFRLLRHAPRMRDAHFMLQDEVVQRMAAAPGEKAWGRLGVMVRYHCRVDALFAVPPEAFAPRPQVRSRIVRLERYASLPHPARDYALLERVVREAFSRRRKTLRNALRGLADDAAFAAAGIDPALRPEALDVDAFVALANVLAASGAAGAPADAGGA
jgi:16S rRNA (adenine1518-N6/adenine1519-N6)-dimethyltransferase